MSNPTEHTSIGDAGNYYGGVKTFESGGKFYWYIENWDSRPDEMPNSECEEIPQYLYDALLKFNNERPCASR